MRRRPVILVSAAAAGASALLAAGCGGGSGSPGVANLGTNAAGTTPAATTQSGSGSSDKAPSGAGAGPSGQFEIGMVVDPQDGPKFSACMRKHGITNFPDPNGQGVISIHSGMGIDPQSPAFTNARRSCDKLLPNGGRPTPAQLAQRQKEMLELAVCMRAHGIKDFPDPGKNGLQIQVHPGSDLDPHNPLFQNAQKACQKYAPPFKGAGSKGGG